MLSVVNTQLISEDSRQKLSWIKMDPANAWDSPGLKQLRRIAERWWLQSLKHVVVKQTPPPS